MDTAEVASDSITPLNRSEISTCTVGVLARQLHRHSAEKM